MTSPAHGIVTSEWADLGGVSSCLREERTSLLQPPMRKRDKGTRMVFLTLIAASLDKGCNALGESNRVEQPVSSGTRGRADHGVREGTRLCQEDPRLVAQCFRSGSFIHHGGLTIRSRYCHYALAR